MIDFSILGSSGMHSETTTRTEVRFRSCFKKDCFCLTFNVDRADRNMSACLLSNTEYLRVNDFAEFLDMKIEQEKLASLRYMRKVNPEAYAYVIKTDRLLTELQG